VDNLGPFGIKTGIGAFEAVAVIIAEVVVGELVCNMLNLAVVLLTGVNGSSVSCSCSGSFSADIMVSKVSVDSRPKSL
jgi:hypothetical protein